MRQAELNVFEVLWRITSGIIGGMLIAAILQDTYSGARGDELLRLGMLVGSFAGYLSTIRKIS